MSWFWIFCAGIAGLAAGIFIGAHLASSSLQPVIRQLSRGLADQHDLFLRVLRRELANWMFRRDPDRYFRIYRKAHEMAAAIGAAARSHQQAQLTKLRKQYPLYADFDLIGTRDHELYADALSMSSYDGIERRFTDIVRFQALKVAFDGDWQEIPRNSATSADDLAHLEKYVRQFKDTRFKNRLKEAINDLDVYTHRKGLTIFSIDQSKPKQTLYETGKFSVHHVPSFGDIRYGVHFKDTNEFGLHTTFFFDDRDKKPLEGCADFDNVILLDDIQIDERL